MYQISASISWICLSTNLMKSYGICCCLPFVNAPKVSASRDHHDDDWPTGNCDVFPLFIGCALFFHITPTIAVAPPALFFFQLPHIFALCPLMWDLCWNSFIVQIAKETASQSRELFSWFQHPFLKVSWRGLFFYLVFTYYEISSWREQWLLER